MTAIVTASDGNWSSTSTWDGGVIPTIDDDVTINHTVIVNSNISALSIHIGVNGQLMGDSSFDSSGKMYRYEVNVSKFTMSGTRYDSREVYLRGAEFIAPNPVRTVSCVKYAEGSFLQTGTMEFPMGDFVMTDPGGMNYTSVLEDLKAEGQSVSGAIWKQCNPYYIQVTVRWPRNTSEAYEEHLRRLVCSPYQGLIFTGSVLLKGFIEQAVLNSDCVGTSYVSYTLSVVRSSL